MFSPLENKRFECGSQQWPKASLCQSGKCIKSECERYRKALESLTPGGSEFSGDSERCVEYVRELINSGHEAKKDRVRLRRLLIEVAHSGVVHDTLGYALVQIDRETWDEIRALRKGEGG